MYNSYEKREIKSHKKEKQIGEDKMKANKIITIWSKNRLGHNHHTNKIKNFDNINKN